MKPWKEMTADEQSDLIRRILARSDEMADEQQKQKERIERLEVSRA